MKQKLFLLALKNVVEFSGVFLAFGLSFKSKGRSISASFGISLLAWMFLDMKTGISQELLRAVQNSGSVNRATCASLFCFRAGNARELIKIVSFLISQSDESAACADVLD